MKGKLRSHKLSPSSRKYDPINDKIPTANTTSQRNSLSKSAAVKKQILPPVKQEYDHVKDDAFSSEKNPEYHFISQQESSSFSSNSSMKLNNLPFKNAITPLAAFKTPYFLYSPSFQSFNCKNADVPNEKKSACKYSTEIIETSHTSMNSKGASQDSVLSHIRRKESPLNTKTSVSSPEKVHALSKISRNSPSVNTVSKRSIFSSSFLEAPYEKNSVSEADTSPFKLVREICDSDTTNIVDEEMFQEKKSSIFCDLEQDDVKYAIPCKPDTESKVAKKRILKKEQLRSQQSKKKFGRELDSLYENLKEISWAQDKNFTTLLLDKESKRYSGRISNIKSVCIDRAKRLNKSEANQNFKRKIIPRKHPQNLKHKVISKKQPQTVSIKQIRKTPSLSLSQKLKTKPRPPPSKKPKSLSLNRKLKTKPRPPPSKKPKIENVKKAGDCEIVKVIHHDKCSLVSDKIKPIKFHSQNMLKTEKKIISEPSKTKKLLLSPDKSILCGTLQKGKKIASCSRSTQHISKMLVKNTIAKTQSIGKGSEKSSSVKSMPCKDKLLVKDISVKSKFGPKEIQQKSYKMDSVFQKFGILHSFFQQESDSTVVSALQRGPELRVTLEPLENTDLWASDCYLQNTLQKEYEAFRKKTIHQTMLKVLASIDQRYASNILQEVQDSIIGGVSGTKASKKKKSDEESIRSSVRQSECAFRYKEIVVKKHQNYIQVVLVPNSNKQNCLTVEAMKELKEAFLSARKDPNCKAVLMNSSGSFFCSGIDLSQLLGSNKKHVAEEMAVTIRDLVLTLAIFPKPVIAAVNGSAIGLGVSLLTFCDIVLASDKATFSIPSARLGYLPEGGVTLTLPQVVGSTVAIEMMLQGRRLTAQQALRHGLVSEVIWPTQLMEHVIPRVQMLVAQQLQVMEATKTMVRCHLWEKLAVQLEREWRMLPTQWLSPTCQQNIKRMLQSNWLID